MRKIFEKKILLLLSSCVLLLLYFPKINILSLGKETAGIRIDDIVLLLLCLFLGWAFLLKNKRIVEIEKIVFSIVFFSLVSFFINRLLFDIGSIHANAKIFYAVRIIEYFLFFYIGCMACRFFSLDKIIKLFLVLNIALMVLQKFGVVGKITSFGKQSIDTYRVSGLASFPAEMGALLNMIFAYLLINQTSSYSFFRVRLSPILTKMKGSLDSFFLFFLFVLLVLLTGARIALITTFVVFFAYQIKTRKIGKINLLYSSLILLLLIVPSAIYFIVNTSSIFTRSLKIFSLNNFNIIVTAWNHVNTDIDLYENIHLTVGDYDMSWWMRIHKWCYALKIYVTHPECYLQGIGPGACSAALDGSFLRILAENGIIGVLLYYKLFRYIYDQTETLKWIMLAFALNMIFFDIYLAYKPMSLLFLLTGFYYQSSQLQVKPSHQAVLA